MTYHSFACHNFAIVKWHTTPQTKIIERKRLVFSTFCIKCMEGGIRTLLEASYQVINMVKLLQYAYLEPARVLYYKEKQQLF
jgi:hypothetical protein